MIYYGIVSGYFNPITVGHIDMIGTAAAKCDKLFVIVNNDVQQKLKIGKIFMTEDKRVQIVNSIKGVYRAVLSVDKNPDISQTLRVIVSGLPAQDTDVLFFNGGDRTTPDPCEAAVCDELGIRMIFLDQPKIDSSRLYRAKGGL